MVGLIGSAAIMFVALYAAHGFSARTTTALVGTLFGLILIAVLGYAATRWSHLSGVAAEDDYVLAAGAGSQAHVRGDLRDHRRGSRSQRRDDHPGLRGVGACGSGRAQQHLFSRAMRIGRDHIASTVYTIAFATAGASLGVFLLIKINNRPLLDVMLTERFAAEVLSILVGLDRARLGSDRCCRGGCGAC